MIIAVSSPPFLIMLVNEDLQNLLCMLNRGKSLDTIHLVQRGEKTLRYGFCGYLVHMEVRCQLQVLALLRNDLTVIYFAKKASFLTIGLRKRLGSACMSSKALYWLIYLPRLKSFRNNFKGSNPNFNFKKPFTI